LIISFISLNLMMLQTNLIMKMSQVKLHITIITGALEINIGTRIGKSEILLKAARQGEE